MNSHLIEVGDIAERLAREANPADLDFQKMAFDCWFTPQEYTLTVATQNADGSSHDWVDDAIAFRGG